MSTVISDTVPEGWRLRRFSEFLRRVERKITVDDSIEYNCVGVRWYGMGTFVRERLSGMQITRKQQWVIREGDVVYNKLFAWKGAFATADHAVDGCIVSDKFPTYEIDLDVIDARFLSYYFRTAHLARKAQDLSRGAAAISKLTLNPPQFSDLTLPLPPLDKQRRIVTRIDELVTKIQIASGLRKQAISDSAGLVGAAVFALFSEGAKKGWVEGKLGDYVTDDRYGTSTKATDDKSGTPVLRMGNIQNGRLDPRDLKYLHLSENERARLLLEKGDILVNRTNSAELVGKCAVFDLDGEHTFASYLIRLRLDTARCEPKLVAAYINSPTGRAYMFDQRKQTTGQANVNAPKLKAMPICLPAMTEQRRIADYLTNLRAKVDALRNLQAETSPEIDHLLRSVLDKAFKGEL